MSNSQTIILRILLKEIKYVNICENHMYISQV